MKQEQDVNATIQQIRTAIRKIAGTFGLDIVELVTAKVSNVDKLKRTCVVIPVTGKADTQIEDVLLSAMPNDGELKIPSKDSIVTIVTSIYGSSYVVGFSDLDEWHVTINNTVVDILDGSIVLGDGSFEGLIKINALTTKLNNLVAEINALKTSLDSHTHLNVTVGTGITGTAIITGSFTNFNKTDYENNIVTHGK